jgi:hypothetical protein
LPRLEYAVDLRTIRGLLLALHFLLRHLGLPHLHGLLRLGHARSVHVGLLRIVQATTMRLHAHQPAAAERAELVALARPHHAETHRHQLLLTCLLLLLLGQLLHHRTQQPQEVFHYLNPPHFSP